MNNREHVEHVMMAGFTHEPVIRLSEKLVEIRHLVEVACEGIDLATAD